MSIDNVLVYDAGVHIGEFNAKIIKLSKVVLMDCLLELVPEAFCDRLEGVVDLFCHFVVDKEFAASLGGRVGGTVIRVLAWVEGQLKRFIEELNIERFWHHDA